MSDVKEYFYSNLREAYERVAGLKLADGIEELYPHQWEAVEWALSRPEPFLFINAPTGSGKTLINTTVGAISEAVWTYAVHTILLQNQVAQTFENLPVFTGRGNFPCLIGEDTHMRKDITAAEAICAVDNYTRGDCDHDGASEHPCPYYAQRNRAMEAGARVVNYALLLGYPPLVATPKTYGHTPTEVLLCDEAHNVEQAVCDSVSLTLSERTLRRVGLKLPEYTDILDWVAWAERAKEYMTWDGPPDLGYRNMARTINYLSAITPDKAGEWIIEQFKGGAAFSPVWGAPFVTEKLMGQAPEMGTLLTRSWKHSGVKKVVFTSATLMGAEYIAETLGLPNGSWAYLDMPSTFAPESRPINFAPVDAMNAAKINDPAARVKMQEAVDNLIEYYVLGGRPWGVIHAVSNKYRDMVLTESRWRAIMVSDPNEHANRVASNEASVLVAANLTEGWDGRDDLCRFVIMPKVPFPNLGDKRTSIRMQEDARSYDHRALVSVVQGAGRGVRHSNDFADTWILDAAWKMLMSKRGSWLPASFKEAYNHNVMLPSVG